MLFYIYVLYIIYIVHTYVYIFACLGFFWAKSCCAQGIIQFYKANPRLEPSTYSFSTLNCLTGYQTLYILYRVWSEIKKYFKYWNIF